MDVTMAVKVRYAGDELTMLDERFRSESCLISGNSDDCCTKDDRMHDSGVGTSKDSHCFPIQEKPIFQLDELTASSFALRMALVRR